MTHFTAKGFVFNVEGDGFARYHASDDFERGVEAIRDAISELSDDDVNAFVVAMKIWQADDCAGERPVLADALEGIGHRAATKGWARPDAVILMLSLA